MTEIIKMMIILLRTAGLAGWSDQAGAGECCVLSLGESGGARLRWVALGGASEALTEARRQ